jgi:ATP-dependent RNA helicase RhlE
MDSFETFNLPKKLYTALDALGFTIPTPIQKESYAVILSGRDMVGIAQTGTGKTLAYLLPLLKNLKYSTQVHPVILVLVPTRELVSQVVNMTSVFSGFMHVRVSGVYGGTNMNPQKQLLAQGTDILVATPGRLYDLALNNSVNLKAVKKLVIDEVDVMLDSGFRFQLSNILEMLPERRQNIMFSATMTDEVTKLIEDYFKAPARISVALSGAPLENILQSSYQAVNFYTKVNLLVHLLSDRNEFRKVLVFVSVKKLADRLFEAMSERFGQETGVMHANKTQNYRFRSVNSFNEGVFRILVTTDLMARGLDLEKITHVINFDTPPYPENYIHRIGRTGRAEQKGKSILFFSGKEEEAKTAIESLMNFKIPVNEFPREVEISSQLIPEERPEPVESGNTVKKLSAGVRGPAFHEKKEKNKKTNQGGSYLRKMKTYKKPQTRGDKNANRRKKNK